MAVPSEGEKKENAKQTKKPKIPIDLDSFGVGEDGSGEIIAWNTKTTPVPFGYQPGRYGSFPIQNAPKQVPYNEASTYLNELRGKGGAEYNNFVKQLKQYTGSKFTSASGAETAWKTVLDDAEASGVNVFELLQRGPSAAGKDESDGKKGRYTGPVESRTIQAESDIKATANALAIELIGRPVSDKELNKLVERMRSAEMQQPNITTSATGSTTTTQGLTAQGREDILREVIAKNPEYEKFQVDTTVLDAMTNFIDKKKQVSGG